MQKWLRQQRSAFLWIDSYSGTKVADWTTSLVLDLIDHTSQLTSFMTLRFCCQKTHQQQPPVTVALVLQSLISQVLESKYECFSDRSPFFTRQRFKAAGNDTELLWTVFHQVLEAAKAPCFLIIDRIGLMQARSPKDENMVFLFIKKLNKLLSLDHMLIKILLTTRVGNNKGSSPALDMAHLAPDAILIRWHHTGSGAVRPYARLPEANPLETIKNSIDSTTGDPFLSEPDTDSESEVENTCSRALMSQSTLVASTKPQDSDEDSFEGSDFGRDPFAEESSDDSFMNTAKSTTLTRKSTMQTISGPNSLDESDTADDWAEDIFGESDGDEDADTLLKSPVTPKTPKIVVAPAEYCPSISKSSSRSIKDEGEIRDGDISSEDGFRSQPFQPNKPNEPRLAPDSDADSDLDF